MTKKDIAVKGSDTILFLKNLKTTGEEAFYPLHLTSHEFEKTRDKETEQTLHGKLSVSSAIEMSGSFEGFISTTDKTLDELNKAIDNDEQMGIWEILLIEDETETEKAKTDGKIEADDESTKAFPSIYREIDVESISKSFEAEGLSTFSADYSAEDEAKGFEYLNKETLSSIKKKLEYKQMNQK